MDVDPSSIAKEPLQKPKEREKSKLVKQHQTGTTEEKAFSISFQANSKAKGM